MKRTSVVFIIFIVLGMEVQAQSHSVLTGTVTEFHRRALAVKSEDGRVIRLRVGWRTLYRDRVPAVGDNVKVAYSVIRGVYVG